MRTILVPVDFSDVTKVLVDEAAKLAKAVGAQVVLLHVVAPHTVAPEAIQWGIAVPASRTVEELAEEHLARLKLQLDAYGVVAHMLRLSGEAAKEIVKQADKLAVDYLIMGAHRHAALYDLVLGSTTQAVLKQARRPVLVVPAGQMERSGSGRGGSAAAGDA